MPQLVIWRWNFIYFNYVLSFYNIYRWAFRLTFSLVASSSILTISYGAWPFRVATITSTNNSAGNI
jgi:hypothetical protein